jgi:hypothetical protein
MRGKGVAWTCTSGINPKANPVKFEVYLADRSVYGSGLKFYMFR